MAKKLSVREVTLFGMLGALTFGAKWTMSVLPNIEPVSLLVMLFAVTFGIRCIYPIAIYIVMEILFYGIQLWNVNYLYVWFLLAAAAWLCRRLQHPLWWALLSGLFGLLFGLLCAPVYIFIGGLKFAITWWLSGLSFDLTHCAGNFVIALLLFVPLRKLLDTLYKKYIL